ncbi:MAG: lasso peptide biosynthesis B2 protein [Actinomycetota bacterium]
MRTARLHARCAFLLVRTYLFPAAEMRRLKGMQVRDPGASEEAVLACSGRWFALLERLGRRPSCLVRSVVLSELLRGEGHPARVVFGVRGGNRALEGHCWVCIGERVVAGEAKDYQEMEDVL